MSATKRAGDNGSGKGRMLPMLLVAGGLAAGGGGGAAAVMMMRTGEPGASSGASTIGAQQSALDAPTAHTFTVPDLVVNPAASGGTRFLVAAVAVGVPDEASLKALTARESEVRDVILGVLGGMTVEQLVRAQANGDARDSLRAAIRQPLVTMFSESAVGRVLLPRLVVQ